MMGDQQPLVTIAIPTYNRAGVFLPQAMESALSQTYQNIEVLVADNCSSDATGEVVLGFQDPRVRYHRHPENIGPFRNLHFCLQQAKGAYVLFLDDDDLVDADFVEVCLRAAAGAPDVGFVRTGMRLIAGDRVLGEFPNQAAGLTTEEFFRAWFAGKVHLYQCNTLFHAARLREVGGFGPEPDLLVDNTAIVRLASRWSRADVEAVKASFRHHTGTFGQGSRTASWCNDSLALLRTMKALIPSSSNQIWHEGLRFFAHQNYRRVGRNVRPGLPALRAQLTVFRAFGFRYPPPHWSAGWLLRRVRSRLGVYR